MAFDQKVAKRGKNYPGVERDKAFGHGKMALVC